MELKKSLRLIDVFCVATGAMISSGLFVLPGLAHAQAGPSVVLSYLIAGALAATGMLSQAELVSAMPKSGGIYFYVTRSMGPALGTINGVVTWMAISFKSSFALVGMAAFTSMVLDVDPGIPAAFFCILFVIINLVGIKEAGIVQTIIVSILVFILGIYVFYGITHMSLDNFTPFMPKGIGSVFSTSGFVFISYGGILKVASIAEEVKDPGKNVPRAMILSLGAVLVLYTAVVFITTGVLSSAELDNSLTPISDGAGVLLGPGGKIVLSVAAILAFISTANAGIMSASRYPMALSRDHLLPGIFSRVHKRFKTPYISLLFTGAFMLVAIFLKLKVLVEVASTVLILTFIFSCVCVIIMRESGVQNYRPSFKSPFYPWVQIGGIFGSWLLVVNMGKEALFLGSLIFAAALAVFWFYGRRRAKRDFALLHLIEKVTAREFLDVTLEEELKEIIRERDEIIKDRFDRVVEESAVLDLEGPLRYEEFFNMAAEKVAPKLDLSADEIVDLFLKREEQSSTVLLPGLAVPHIIVPGRSKFIMLLARCRKGIDFPAQKEPVSIVFVIAGSRDERTFHLRALSAIAQIVDDPSFAQRWLGASNPQALKDIILLGKRKRNI